MNIYKYFLLVLLLLSQEKRYGFFYKKIKNKKIIKKRIIGDPIGDPVPYRGIPVPILVPG